MLISETPQYIDVTGEEWEADKNWHDKVWDLRCKLKELLESGEYVESPQMEAELIDEVLNLVLKWYWSKDENS